jgi:hypothetical protein
MEASKESTGAYCCRKDFASSILASLIGFSWMTEGVTAFVATTFVLIPGSEELGSNVLCECRYVAGEPGRLFLGTATESSVLDRVLESFIEAELEALLRISSSGASPRRPLGFAFVW